MTFIDSARTAEIPQEHQMSPEYVQQEATVIQKRRCPTLWVDRMQ